MTDVVDPNSLVPPPGMELEQMDKQLLRELWREHVRKLLDTIKNGQATAAHHQAINQLMHQNGITVPVGRGKGARTARAMLESISEQMPVQD